jgi:hypothetical protein
VHTRALLCRAYLREKANEVPNESVCKETKMKQLWLFSYVMVQHKISINLQRICLVA